MADRPQTTVEQIMEGAGPLLPKIEIFHNQVLVAIFMAGDMTSGGIILPDSVKAEDQWQGKVGLVLKKGPTAFVNDRNNDFSGQNVEVGEWVVYRVNEAIAIDLQITRSDRIHCRLVQDIHIRGRVSDPTVIW